MHTNVILTNKRRTRVLKPVVQSRNCQTQLTYTPRPIDVINVEMKIKKREKAGRKLKKNVCKRWIKNVADICHESNYYLCTLSHM